MFTEFILSVRNKVELVAIDHLHFSQQSKKIWIKKKNSKYSTIRSAGNILLTILPYYFWFIHFVFPLIETLLLTPSSTIHQLHSILQKVNFKKFTYSEHLRHNIAILRSHLYINKMHHMNYMY